jgi:hypothetical protein
MEYLQTRISPTTQATTSNDFKSLRDLEQHLMELQRYHEQIAKPFELKFTREDLTALPKKLKPASLTTERFAA